MATYKTIPENEYGSFSWLEREVGAYLGKGFNPDAWDHETAAKIASIVQSGVNQFLYPPPLPDKDGKAVPHRWSFLSPVAEMTLAIDQSVYELPEDFAALTDEGFTVG